MKKKIESPLAQQFKKFKNFIFTNKIFFISTIVSFFILSLVTYLNLADLNSFKQLRLHDFEPGKVSDRDIVASREFMFIDEEATQIRKNARQNTITAVFKYDVSISNSLLAHFDQFVLFLHEALSSTSSSDAFLLAVQQEFPGILSSAITQELYLSLHKEEIITTAQQIFKKIINEGITVFPDKGMELYNQNNIEIVRQRTDRQEHIEVAKKTVLTKDAVFNYVEESLLYFKKNRAYAQIIYQIISPFIKENVIYQADESETKLEAAIKQITPVYVVIPKGHKIIKRGFIITEEAFNQLKALSSAGIYIDLRQFLGTLMCLFFTALLAYYIFSLDVFGPPMELKKQLLVLIAFDIQYIILVLTNRNPLFAQSLDIAMVMTIALMTMTITLLTNQRTGVLISFIFTLGSLSATNFSLGPSLFALFSGIAGVSVIRITGKRLDLIISSSILAIVNPIFLYMLLMLFPGSSRDPAMLLIGGAINGFMSGIILLGFLPILESVLNTSTSFRLMEFSDLNSPIMKKMLITISGTYNHSMMVATLAETACREIGADPLIARVGAYYHDIGKMDQSEYFVENQTTDNKHLAINPRLSATIIRSHVKQGIEKARQLRLPKEVIDIIAEHHGNSLISYFYNEAKQENPDIDPEDFMYQGPSPRTKESAVVMLADVVEAACRTLEKPTVPRLEKFITELINQKIETNQLDNSELTFRDIGIIKNTFVNVLAGYYHSRIEYHKQKVSDAEEDIKDTEPKKTKGKQGA